MSAYTLIAVAVKKGLEGQEIIDFCVSFGIERAVAVAAHKEILKGLK